ncbi:MAG TPA: BamA/TamA family outer membrane protein [Steroidobacteraceae bacterium]|nr:BamA/TamA family outer membrane protein [Steroidobacteraceae bacterium]
MSRSLIVVACLAPVPRALADIQIDVRGVNDPLRTNVEAFLSLSRYKTREVDDPMMARLTSRIDREVTEALEPFGYYDPTVKSSVSRRPKGGWRVLIEIDPGRPVMVASVTVAVTGPGRDDPHFVRLLDHPTIRAGERLEHSAYEEMKTELQRAAATYGYLDARFTRSELLVDPRRLRASVMLKLATGVRYRFGPTSFEQRVIRPALARRYLRYREGDAYDESQLLRTQFALEDSQYFSTVVVEPGEPDRTRHVVPVLITARPNRLDRYSFSAGYGTDTGPRGTLQWDRTRLGQGGERFGVQLEASKYLQVLQALYSIPIGDPAVDRLALGATADYGIPGDLIDKDFAVGPSLTRVVGDWQYVFSVSPTHSITYDSITTRTQDLIVPAVTVGSVPNGYLGQALFAQGFVAQLRAGTGITGGSDRFLQLHVQAQHAFDFSDGWHLLLRGEAGATAVGSLTDLPGSMRFFAGGEGSVRGFTYDDLSPVEEKLVAVSGSSELAPEYLKVGGRDVLTGSVETVRDISRAFGVALFSDFGNAFDTLGQSGSPYTRFIEYSAGIGFRWRLPVVTLGVDVAQPVSRPGGGPRFDIYFGPKL